MSHKPCSNSIHHYTMRSHCSLGIESSWKNTGHHHKTLSKLQDANDYFLRHVSCILHYVCKHKISPKIKVTYACDFDIFLRHIEVHIHMWGYRSHPMYSYQDSGSSQRTSLYCNNNVIQNEIYHFRLNEN